MMASIRLLSLEFTKIFCIIESQLAGFAGGSYPGCDFVVRVVRFPPNYKFKFSGNFIYL